MKKSILQSRSKAKQVSRKNQDWEPNDYIFHKEGQDNIGIKAVKDYLSVCGINNILIYSTMQEVKNLKQDLNLKHMPDNISQYLLPMWFHDGALPGFVTCEPNSNCPIHKHDQVSGFYLIISGSLILNSYINLKSGDWFYAPQGVEYGFSTFHDGCLLFHVYDPGK